MDNYTTFVVDDLRTEEGGYDHKRMAFLYFRANNDKTAGVYLGRDNLLHLREAIDRELERMDAS